MLRHDSIDYGYTTALPPRARVRTRLRACGWGTSTHFHWAAVRASRLFLSFPALAAAKRLRAAERERFEGASRSWDSTELLLFHSISPSWPVCTLSTCLRHSCLSRASYVQPSADLGAASKYSSRWLACHGVRVWERPSGPQQEPSGSRTRSSCSLVRLHTHAWSRPSRRFATLQAWCWHQARTRARVTFAS